MIDNNWIEDLLKKSKENTKNEITAFKNPFEQALISKVIDDCYRIHHLDTQIPLGRILASGFDLIVSANYYSNIGHKGWFYCPEPAPKLYYHFTNCCPRHSIANVFVFHPSSKPESGSIGTSTSRLLRSYLSSLIIRNGRKEAILKGSEPVDVVIVDESNYKIFFGEIKASPLLTIPLCMDSEPLTDSEGNLIKSHDSNLTINTVFNRKMNLFVPKFENGEWVEAYFNLGDRSDVNDKAWGYRSMVELLNRDSTFIASYYNFWDSALTAYHPKHTQNIYWLTNACGVPSPRPKDWPKSKGGDGNGCESISDSKTSVGMDRTDDIKKGIYQVLKLGSEGKPVISKWDFKVGILSNIHAARHFDEYLKSLKNLIWTHEATGKAKQAGDLKPEHPLYNLFDGIIALTECHFRDEWLEEVFGFLKK